MAKRITDKMLVEDRGGTLILVGGKYSGKYRGWVVAVTNRNKTVAYELRKRIRGGYRYKKIPPTKMKIVR